VLADENQKPESKNQKPESEIAFYALLFGGAAILVLGTLFAFGERTIDSLKVTGALVSIATLGTLITDMFVDRRTAAKQEKKIAQIEVRAEEAPEKTKFAWDLARVTLGAYFDRNLSQVKMIFFVAVTVMAVGFIFIIWGINLAITKPEVVKTSYIAAASGIITEFIGVTFMVIYRSTMAQANQFMEVLERINTVGMAVQILDAIPEQETQLKNSTRAEIVALLLSVNARSKSGAKPMKEKKRASA